MHPKWKDLLCSLLFMLMGLLRMLPVCTYSLENGSMDVTVV